MDTSITLVTPAMHRQRGADAFDRGQGIDEHHMNPDAPAVADWQQGWRDRRATVHAVVLIKHLTGVGTPP